MRLLLSQVPLPSEVAHGLRRQVASAKLVVDDPVVGFLAVLEFELPGLEMYSQSLADSVPVMAIQKDVVASPDCQWLSATFLLYVCLKLGVLILRQWRDEL